MSYNTQLIGREAEQKILRQALKQAQEGQGGFLLVGGEAGMGKTRLVDEVLSATGELYLHYACHELRTPAFAPIASILRQYMNHTAVDFKDIGPWAACLNLLLPEMGPEPEDSGDQSTLLEAINVALSVLSNIKPAAIVIDDLQWADNATLDVILSLANHLPTIPVLLVGVYRSDEIPRGHPLRWLRNQLRRSRTARELKIMPLAQAETIALAESVIRQQISPPLAKMLHQRSEGVPLFVEQLIVALESEERLQTGDKGSQLADNDELPIPETIRDVVLLRLDGLTEASRQFAEVAAVVGDHFDLIRVVKLAGGDAGLDQLIAHGLIINSSVQKAAFHHALTREVIYREIPWTRRRALHRAVAEQLAEEGAPAEVVAGHWLEARDNEQARLELAKAARHACHIHAYRDAAGFGNQALELWPDGQEEEARLAVVEQFGNCAQLSGMLPDAARAWREAAAKRCQLGQVGDYAVTQRRLAAVLELQGAWTQAMTARMTAAESFKQVGQIGKAAEEYLALASKLQLQAQFSQSLRYAEEAKRMAEEAERRDLAFRAAGLYGRLLAKLGQVNEGMKITREALSQALEASYTDAAVENFLNLASVLEQTSDFAASRATYEEAADYCHSHGEIAVEQVCQQCLAYALWSLGEWDEALAVARGVLVSEVASDLVKTGALGLIGQVQFLRGDIEEARPAIQTTLIDARRANNFNLLFLNEWEMAVITARENRPEAMMEHWQQANEIWQRAEDNFLGPIVFRWAATHFAMLGQSEQVQQSISALNQIVTRTSKSEALAGLAHALGENLLLEGNASKAVIQFEQAMALQDPQQQSPYFKAQTLWRLGVALLEAGETQQAVERLKMAHAIFTDLGAQPDYQIIERLLIELGQSGALPTNDKNNQRLQQAGLTRRQLEVLSMIAAGMTNREVADELVLSPRTVEMHVANTLNKLGCNNRTEAVARAVELGLL